MKEFIEKLIERLEEEAKWHEKRWNDGTSNHALQEHKAFVKAISIVNQLEEEYNNGWILVSEKLPNKDLWCLATFESGSVDKIQYLTTNKWGWNGEFADNKVIAWQQLPEPYEEEGNSTKKFTNADRIRNMSDEELAELFTIWSCEDNDYTTLLEIEDCMWGTKKEIIERNLKWLQSEAEQE